MFKSEPWNIMDIATKKLTDKQAAFLEALLGEARGNIQAGGVRQIGSSIRSLGIVNSMRRLESATL